MPRLSARQVAIHADAPPAEVGRIAEVELLVKRPLRAEPLVDRVSVPLDVAPRDRLLRRRDTKAVQRLGTRVTDHRLM